MTSTGADGGSGVGGFYYTLTCWFSDYFLCLRWAAVAQTLKEGELLQRLYPLMAYFGYWSSLMITVMGFSLPLRVGVYVWSVCRWSFGCWSPDWLLRCTERAPPNFQDGPSTFSSLQHFRHGLNVRSCWGTPQALQQQCGGVHLL